MSLEEDIKASILRDIALTGSASLGNAQFKVTLANEHNRDNIITLSSGLPRLRTNVIPKFDLILNQPSSLKVINNLEIRCCICKKVISYPAWYYRLAFVANHIHYFICFDAASPSKVTAKCYHQVLVRTLNK